MHFIGLNKKNNAWNLSVLKHIRLRSDKKLCIGIKNRNYNW
jgi:hypothetical protein